MMQLVPLTQKRANEHVKEHHRHHPPVRGDYFRVGCAVDGELRGVVIAGLPNAPELCKNGHTCEVTRLCTDGEERHVGTFLLGAIVRAGLALGWRRFVSYTRIDEPGTVYRAANWRPVARVKGRRWDTGNKRGRKGRKPSTEIIDRVRWECGPEALTELPALKRLGRRDGVPPGPDREVGRPSGRAQAARGLTKDQFGSMPYRARGYAR